jgi:DNA adenine methylase
VTGPLPYIGGKRRIAPQIVKLLPPHITYVEIFAGGAQTFFHKPPSAVEVLNDLDGELVNYLRVLQQHSPELVRWLRHMVASRALHELFSRQDPTQLTDVQRAARFLYLQKNSFGGRVTKRSFNVAVTKPPNYTTSRLPQIMDAAARRLEHAQIECSPYEVVIRRFDRPTTVFYLDPPYIGRSLYRHNFRDDDFALLADRLHRVKGRFLLSINDHPLSRRLFAGFNQRTIDFVYTATRSVPRVSELLIANYDFPVDPVRSTTSTEMNTSP